MRMWMIPPELLCRKHLAGEHGEIHKHRHNFVKQHNMSGRLYPIVQIEPANIQSRHDELAREMLKRGYKHESPFEQPDISYMGEKANVKVNLSYNLKDLMNRCPDCKTRIENFNENS